MFRSWLWLTLTGRHLVQLPSGPNLLLRHFASTNLGTVLMDAIFCLYSYSIQELYNNMMKKKQTAFAIWNVDIYFKIKKKVSEQ